MIPDQPQHEQDQPTGNCDICGGWAHLVEGTCPNCRHAASWPDKRAPVSKSQRKRLAIQRGERPGNEWPRTHNELDRTFTVTVTMRKRWIPHFLAMLKYMEFLGGIGASRNVGIYADGDGDFRPRFQLDGTLPCLAEPVSDNDGARIYDAG